MTLYPIDESLFDELAGCSPDEVCNRAACSYDAAQNAYILSAWGDEYVVSPVRRRVDCRRGGGPGPHAYFGVFLIHHLLKARASGSASAWISEKDIPGGQTFFRGPHEIPTHKISYRYKNDIYLYAKRCAQLGGLPLAMADRAFRFMITPRTPVAVLYWLGDEDFPPEARILFDRFLAGYLAADVLFALAVDVCERLSE